MDELVEHSKANSRAVRPNGLYVNVLNKHRPQREGYQQTNG
jgi:hypothetical protein